MDKEQELRILHGNVVLKQGDVTMKCDSAYFYVAQNQVKAFGKVLIEQGDSVTIKAERLFYDGNTKNAQLERKVFLTDKKAEITADSLDYSLLTKKALLRKNVLLKDSSSTAKSEKLIYYVKNKQAELYKNVHLHDEKEQTDIFAQEVFYNLRSGKAELNKSVKLVQEESEIITETMHYNTKTAEGSYENGGQLTNKDQTLTSKRATFLSKQHKAVFQENVHLKTKDYDLRTPQLDYDTRSKKADFSGKSVITSKDGTINANKGSYDSENDRLELAERTTIANKGQIIESDRFWNDKKKGYSHAEGSVILTDTAENRILYADIARIYDKDKRMEAFGNALLQQVIDKDTLFLAADTIVSSKPAKSNTENKNVIDNKNIGTNNNRDDSKSGQKDEQLNNIKAYHHVRILKPDLQGVCDSLAYMQQDSTFRMYGKPVIWHKDYQLSADTILVETAHEKPYRIFLNSKALIGNQVQAGVYNQIGGKRITGFFENGDMQKMLADGSAESIYYAQDDDNSFTGVNRSFSGKMWLFFDDDELSRINFMNMPTATFYPMQDIKTKDFVLKGFEWKHKLRPQTLADLKKKL